MTIQIIPTEEETDFFERIFSVEEMNTHLNTRIPADTKLETLRILVRDTAPHVLADIHLRHHSNIPIIDIDTPNLETSIITLLKVCKKESDPKIFYNYLSQHKHGFFVEVNSKRVYDKMAVDGQLIEYIVYEKANQ